jgi:hypothetical protein
MRIEIQLKYIASGKGAAAQIIERARRECLTQSVMLEMLSANTARLPAVPGLIRDDVRLFTEGYRAAILTHEVTHLYCVDGRLYRHPDHMSPAAIRQLPQWDTLPRERYSSMLSGLYWINNGDPRLYFS